LSCLALFFKGKLLLHGDYSCGPFYKVYDAEATALAFGLRAALEHLLASTANYLWACLDNQAVFKAVYNRPRRTSQYLIHEAILLLNK
jgi:hypothetical protein